MEFKTIFRLFPISKGPFPHPAELVSLLLLWAALCLALLCAKMVYALRLLVPLYLSLVLAFARDKNFVVAVVSWLSLLRFWKPWAASTADLRPEVDLAVDFIFRVWFLMGVPIIVMTIWFGLMGVLRLAGNEVVRRIHAAMEFEFDLTDYVVKCYCPMQLGAIGDRVVAEQRRCFQTCRELNLDFLPKRYPQPPPSRPRVDPLSRGRRLVREPVKTARMREEELRAQKELKKYVMELRRMVAARKEGKTTVEQPIIDPKPTTSDNEERAPAAAPSVPQSRDASAPAWPADAESETVTDDVTIANGQQQQEETEEPADRTQSRGEGLVGPDPEAPEPEASSGVEGNGLPEGAEDSRAEEPEISHEKEGESSAEEPESPSGEEGEGPAEEPESSPEEDGEGPLLYGVDPANDPEISFEVEGEAPSTATVPEAAQEPETSHEEEGESLLNVDTAPAEELETSMEVDSEGWSTHVGGNMDETSYGVESDVEMADAEPLTGMEVPRPSSYDPCWNNNSNSQETILPLEVAATGSSAGQKPVSCDETRGWLDVSPAHQSAQNLSAAADCHTYLEVDYATADPDQLDRQLDDLLFSGASNGAQPTATDSWFGEYEAWLATIPADADTTAAANNIIIDEDEEMADAVFDPKWDSYRGAPDFDSDNEDSVTDEESPISDPFVLPGPWASGIDEGMASLDLVGSSSIVPDTDIELITAAIAQYDLRPVKDTTTTTTIIIDEQQRSQEDVDMAELQRLLSPVIVFNNMTAPEEPADNATELNRPIPPVIEMTEPEEPTPTVVVYATGFEGCIEMAEPEEPTPPVDDVVPDAAPNSPAKSVSSPRTPYMGEDDEDWDEEEDSIDLEDMFDFMLERTPPQTPTRAARSTSEDRVVFSGEASPELAPSPSQLVLSPGSSLIDELEAAFLLPTPPRTIFRSPSPDQDVPRWAFPPDMVDNSAGVATNLSLNELFNNNRPTVEANPPTESAADDLSNEKPTPTDRAPGPDSVTEAQEPTSEDHTQAGSSESPDDDNATLASEAAVVGKEQQQPETEPPTPVTIPTIIITPEPSRTKEVEVAPIRMGGLLLPGGNLILPATPAPMTPLSQQTVKIPDAEELKKQKEESLARDLRNVMRRRQPASVFHRKLPQKSSALIRSPDAAEREAQLRSPQSFHALSRAGSDANGGADAVDEGAAKVILASPAVMKAIRASEAQREVLHEGNADER
ncbi:hypothetical protein ACQKWADRAFT_329450 [Trichoderma austrokoningii]